jgi:hypothetical protein
MTDNKERESRESLAVLFCMNDATHKRCENYNCSNCNNPDGKYFTFADISLQREKEIRAEFEKDKEALLSDIRRLTKEKYDERS